MTADEVIAAVLDAVERTPGADIVYVHGTPSGGAHAAIVKVGTPAYDAIAAAYPDRPVPPHDHIEPGEDNAGVIARNQETRRTLDRMPLEPNGWVEITVRVTSSAATPPPVEVLGCSDGIDPAARRIPHTPLGVDPASYRGAR